VAVYRARRYRLSRTAWRGIRGTLTGNALGFGSAAFWSTIANTLTLGWMTPWQANMLNRQLTNDMQFGDRQFSYRGQAGPLYPRFTLMWFGLTALYVLFIFAIAGLTATFPNLMEIAPDGVTYQPTPAMWALFALTFLFFYVLYNVISAIYQVRVLSHFAEHTGYGDGVSFRLNAATLSYAYVVVTNAVILIVSLTILKPVTQARTLRYLVERLEVEGAVDFASIGQNQRALDRAGEGLAQAFDIDAF